MKAKILCVVLLGTCLMMNGCKKEVPEPKEACEIYNTGNYIIVNKTSKTIDVSLDGNYEFTFTTGEEKQMNDLSAGVHTIHAKSTDNYVWDFSIDVIQCQTHQRSLIL